MPTYGTVQYSLPSISNAYLALTNFRDTVVQDADLGVDGRLADPIVTLRNGLIDWTTEADDYLANQFQFSIQLGRSHCLPPSDETIDGSVLLYVSVKSVQLIKMHALLGNMASFTSPASQYQPCIGIAYINAAVASAYENLSIGFISHVVDSFDVILADTTSSTITLRTF